MRLLVIGVTSGAVVLGVGGGGCRASHIPQAAFLWLRRKEPDMERPYRSEADRLPFRPLMALFLTRICIPTAPQSV